MFHRKGLFWYSTKQKYFDWSTALYSVFGYGDPYLKSRIKNRLKQIPYTDFPPSAKPTYLQSQFSRWIKSYPFLTRYDFFLISELELFSICSRLKIVSQPWEEDLDPFLHHLKLKGSPPPSAQGNLITDISLFHAGELPPGPRWLYLNSGFPTIPSPHEEVAEDFAAIIVGGKHPYNLNGQKLILLSIRSEKYGFTQEPQSDYFHLGVYEDGIRHYYDLLKRPGFSKRTMSVEKSIGRMITWGKEESRKIEFIPSLQPFSYRAILSKKSKKTLSQVGDYRSSRLFYRDLTIIAHEEKSHTEFLIHLPINFPTQHLENKWKTLTALFREL